MNNGTARVLCTCEHEVQDKLYGKQTRVANATQRNDDTSVEVRCTVCKRVHKVKKGQVK